MSTESIVSEIKRRTQGEGAVENDGKSLLYITKINIKNEDNLVKSDSEKLFNTLLKDDIIDHPIYNTESLTKKLNELRNTWVELNLFTQDNVKFEVDLCSNTTEYENQIKEIVESSFADAQEDYLHQREIFNSNKPIPVELNVYSKLNGFEKSKFKLSAAASDKSPFTYQLSYLGNSLTVQNNAVLNYSLHLKTSVLKDIYNSTFQFNMNTKFIRQPNSKMYFQSNFGLAEKHSTLNNVKLGFFKQITKSSNLDLSFQTNFNQKLNILLSYQQNLDKVNKFNFKFDHDVLSQKNAWDASLISKFSKLNCISTDNKLVFNEDSLNNKFTVKTGQNVFSSVAVANKFKIPSSEITSDVILSAGVNSSKNGPSFEFGYKQSIGSELDLNKGFFYNILWQY
ncbi:hypothetical protein QEN19_002374 [Hanseniaspora menglaensis]